jgi:hypothetical protein
MRNGPTDISQVIGIGEYVGEIRQGPDGSLYEWAAGVDGLGNPVGFWKKALRAVKGGVLKVARAGLARLIPAPIKRLARGACSAVDQIGPAVTSVPAAIPYYAGAKGFCRVLRGAGIAGTGSVMEVAPSAAAAVPPAARAAAKTVCGMINRLGPVLKYIPVASSYHKKATNLCTALRSAGIAGADGPIMESDGKLYEVVEGIGEFGERRRYLRPVRLVIPAYIDGRRRARRVAKPGLRQRPRIVAATNAQPVAPSARVNGFGEFY